MVVMSGSVVSKLVSSPVEVIVAASSVAATVAASSVVATEEVMNHD